MEEVKKIKIELKENNQINNNHDQNNNENNNNNNNNIKNEINNNHFEENLETELELSYRRQKKKDPKYKEERRSQFWKQKREKQKEKTKEKKANDKEYRITLGNKQAQKKEIREKWRNGEVEIHLPHVVIDLQWSKEMGEKGNRKIFSQLAHLWGYQKNSSRPLTIHVTDYDKNSLEIFFNRHNCDSWKQMNFHPENFLDVFKKEDIIYLTPDSPNTLEDIDETKIYIIGGIIDGFNKSKNLSFSKANEIGLKTGKLPLQKNVKNPALNINHVANILTDFCIEKKWSVMDKFIPKRYEQEKKKNKNKTKSESKVKVENVKDEIEEKKEIEKE